MFSINVDNFSQWRKQARAMLQRGIAPTEISWETDRQPSLFADAPAGNYEDLPVLHAELRLPKSFYPLAERVSCFRDRRRWPLLYRVAWRLLFENKRLLHCPIDEDVSQLLSMQKAVNRDRHKMAAFVRFKKITDTTSVEGQNNTRYVAWFEPEHLIVASKAPFFVKRFSNIQWSLLTPDTCAHWDLKQLYFTGGLNKPPNIEDELEQLWLTYYRHIFNPARLKLKAMQAEMPKKYWVNLPEAALIPELTRNAQARTDSMIAQQHTPAWNKTRQSRFIHNIRQQLRNQ